MLLPEHPKNVSPFGPAVWPLQLTYKQIYMNEEVKQDKNIMTH